MSGGEGGRGGGGEMVLSENLCHALKSDNIPKSEEKLGEKVLDGKGSGGEAQRVLVYGNFMQIFDLLSNCQPMYG